MQEQITPTTFDSQVSFPIPAIIYLTLDHDKQAAIPNLDTSIKSAWLYGHAMTSVKARLPNGAWRAWLTEVDIGKDTANHLINFATISPDELDKHRSVNAALLNLKVKRQAALPLGKTPPANVATLRQTDPADVPANDDFPLPIDAELPPPLDDAAVELEPASLGKTALAIEADYTDAGSSQADVIGYLRAQVDELTDQLVAEREVGGGLQR